MVAHHEAHQCLILMRPQVDVALGEPIVERLQRFLFAYRIVFPPCRRQSPQRAEVAAFLVDLGCFL